MEIFADKASPGKGCLPVPPSIIHLPKTAGDSSAVILWQQLLLLSSNGAFESQEQLAGLCGRTLITWRRLISRLKELGLLESDGKNIVLLVPGEQLVLDPKPKKRRAKTKQPAVNGYSELIDAWNKYKPPAYASLSDLNPKALEAYNYQIKNSNHDINDHDGFVKIVCAGILNSDFWSNKSLKFYSIFGYGPPTEKKIRNVESLYNDGKRSFKAPIPEVEYTYDKESIISRFNSWYSLNYEGLPGKTNACVVTAPADYKLNAQDFLSTVRKYISLQAKTCVGMGQLDAQEINGIESFFKRTGINPCSYMFYYNEEHGWPTETRPVGSNRLQSLDDDLWIFYENPDQVFKTKPHMIHDVW
jgi:hypothetical protein